MSNKNNTTGFHPLDHDDFGSIQSKIMNVIDSNILRSGMRAENRCTLFLIPLSIISLTFSRPRPLCCAPPRSLRAARRVVADLAFVPFSVI
ncbi:hypothetical protein Nham_4040 [Nitrobacter hamburgensis X14]|uniref:Uncharacterized protein n=1 Tax=Nitrobacter hamburgensis (strain DSM 10229 / NCIMB 13809 / X14) TaxID=323097 RepID=Q1QGE1_NITHX|nr:hypothetical protein [Nitrobacter hamburgensis]ABE64706.1 hypothetical protein Nham_4040 [Nitrobacter hamburgensis X14]